MLSTLAEAILKILIAAIVCHFVYLLLAKIAIKKSSLDIPGGLIAKLLNDWFDVYQKSNTDWQYKLILLIHIFPASLITVLIWHSLFQAILILNGIFLFLIVFSTTRRD